MTLEEQLSEVKDLKTLLIDSMKQNVEAGSLLGYTTNGTKVTYEGATKTRDLISYYNSEIAQLQSLLPNAQRLSF